MASYIGASAEQEDADPIGGGSFCPSGPRFSGLRAVDKPAPETHNKAINTPKIGCPAST